MMMQLAERSTNDSEIKYSLTWVITKLYCKNVEVFVNFPYF